MVAALAVAGTIVLTVYGQLVIKWQVSRAGARTARTGDRVRYALDLMANPFVITVYLAVGAAGLLWIVVMTKLDLSRAYPFVSLAFALVVVLSAVFFDEPLSVPKVVGVALIVLGVAIGTQG